MKGMKTEDGLEWKGWEWKRIRMKGMKTEDGLEWKGWRVKADQNERDEDWSQIRIKEFSTFF